MTRIKICGITNHEDAMTAVSLGADALGFVFAPSPRQVRASQAREIRESLPSRVAVVGVFTDQSVEFMSQVGEICRLDCFQIHGTISADAERILGDRIIPAIEVVNSDPISVVAALSQSIVLLDAAHERHGGVPTVPFDWNLAKKSSQLKKIILAGGLNPENVVDALELVRPFAVDVARGVEKSPGEKDYDKLELFIQRIRAWDSRTSAGISAISADSSFPKR